MKDYYKKYNEFNKEIISDIISLLKGKKEYIFNYPKEKDYTPYFYAVVVTDDGVEEVPIKGFEIDEDDRIRYILFNPENDENKNGVDFGETYDYEDCIGDTTFLLICILEEMESELKK